MRLKDCARRWMTAPNNLGSKLSAYRRLWIYDRDCIGTIGKYAKSANQQFQIKPAKPLPLEFLKSQRIVLAAQCKYFRCQLCAQSHSVTMQDESNPTAQPRDGTARQFRVSRKIWSDRILGTRRD